MGEMVSTPGIVVSFGAGVNSTAMVLLLRRHGYPIREIVFVDTGCEFPETYEYLNYLIDEMGWDISVVKPRVEGCSSLLEYCYKYEISPFKHLRWCTDKFKLRPFYSRLTPPAIIANGMGFLHVYPLIDFRMDRDACVRLIEREGLRVPVKSGCYICPFMDKKRREYLRRNHPNLWRIREEVLSFRKIRRNHTLDEFTGTSTSAALPQPGPQDASCTPCPQGTRP